MKKLNVAIVGFGFMGRTHYGVWKKMRNARVACVCDSNLAQISAKTKGNLDVADDSELPASVRVYDDFDKMLESEKLDVVDITLPTPLHPVMAVKALAKDINVLCEKPMAIDAKTCDRMVAAEKKSKGRLMIAQCVRYWPEYLVLKDYIDSGKYGIALCEHEGEVVGFVTWAINGIWGEICNNGALTETGLKGIGQTMYKYVMEEFKQKGVKVVKVTTGLDWAHAPARRAYERAGFKRHLDSTTYFMELE